MGQYWEWHLSQLVAAIDLVAKSHPHALAPIPQEGFHVRALRRIGEESNGKYTHVIAVGICENYGIDKGLFHVATIAFANNVEDEDFAVEGIDFIVTGENEFIPVLEKLVLRIPDGWREYAARNTAGASWCSRL